MSRMLHLARMVKSWQEAVAKVMEHATQETQEDWASCEQRSLKEQLEL